MLHPGGTPVISTLTSRAGNSLRVPADCRGGEQCAGKKGEMDMGELWQSVCPRVSKMTHGPSLVPFTGLFIHLAAKASRRLTLRGPQNLQMEGARVPRLTAYALPLAPSRSHLTWVSNRLHQSTRPLGHATKIWRLSVAKASANLTDTGQP